MIQIVLSLAVLVATIVSLANIITSDPLDVRYLPKVFWIILVIIVPIIGMVLWWTLGKDRSFSTAEAVPFGDPRRYENRMPARTFGDDDDIDAAVEREIAFHENEARIRRLEAEVRARRQEPPTE